MTSGWRMPQSDREQEEKHYEKRCGTHHHRAPDRPVRTAAIYASEPD